jgi:hypothetical protein
VLAILHIVLESALRGWAAPGPQGQQLADTLANLFCCGIFLLVPVLILVFRDILGQLAMARSPAECWHTNPAAD